MLTIVRQTEFQADKLFRRVCESAFQDVAMWRNAQTSVLLFLARHVHRIEKLIRTRELFFI